jgi:alkylation response protein AidB-like acyl-CoA dehydrogenase
MPVRHEDDFRRKPIKDWDTYVQDAIEEAIEAGAFDNLPGHGKPIRIESNPHAPELDFAFSRLKNAGYLPVWMELDQMVKAGQESMAAFLADSAAWLQTHAVVVRAGLGRGPETQQSRSWLRRLWSGPADPSPADDGPQSMADLRAIRDRMRQQYLVRAAELDKKIGEFNNALSRDLWHLERMRLTPERAAARFDEAMAAVNLDG